MKTIYLTLVTLLLSTIGFAQNGTVNGKITDNFGQELERAWVLILNADDLSYVAGTITDENGEFEIPCDIEEDYVISVHHISFDEPKILGSLSSYININELEKLTLSQLGTELTVETSQANFATNTKFQK